MKKEKNKVMDEKEQDIQKEEGERELKESMEEDFDDENPEDEEESLAEEESELDELRSKYLRLVAEFDNYRKRVARERIELMQTAEKDVVVSILDVLDDADRAADQMEKTEDIGVVREGALLIFNKLHKALKSKGLKEMESLHNDFDAELHDAIAEVPAPSKDLEGKVIDIIQKGYYLNDKIIRHAKVVVGK